MTIRARKHFVTWPGIVAMWLIVFTPLAVQLLKLGESPEPVAVNCSADKSESARQQTLADNFSVCDHCDLVAQQAIAVTSVTALEIAAILLATVLVLVPLTRADDSSARAARCTEPEAGRECSTPLQNQC
ncbi:conserved hypothetical protein [Paraburkholderia piptadeniae]|uniref:DUF2946 domain-containing protein n=1 Tax=Paraburkholderia piptadeniae TaxID=1701573 RepID=A0A1N7SW52_9BURK|nr:hypothetical protein [Paraburkholderia piptadeniae]SIT51671.1 conserved hypothetical protein [Paraburkholderia piptadeniae]